MIKNLAKKAKDASRILINKSDKEINQTLENIAKLLIEHSDDIISANQIDIDNAKQNSISEVMIDRLRLDKERIENIAKAVIAISKLEQVNGRILEEFTINAGATVQKISVPFGVIAIIYESRPNVTVDAASIALKTKNAVVLKGGKESIHSNKAIIKIIKKALIKSNFPTASISFVDDNSREASEELIKLRTYIDLLIPRGGKGLINWVTSNATVPVIETGAGNCHIYIDEEADFEMALSIIDNAKTSRPSVCNAAEKVIIAETIATSFIPKLKMRLKDKVELLADESAKKYLPNAKLMTEDEKYNEFLDYKLGVIVSQNLKTAVNWINQYGSHHSDAIITNNTENAKYFQTVVDSAAVYHNASTRFTDGGEFGFGAEIGIATSKLHARGPMALREMTTYKYIINGKGEIR